MTAGVRSVVLLERCGMHVSSELNVPGSFLQDLNDMSIMPKCMDIKTHLSADFAPKHDTVRYQLRPMSTCLLVWPTVV